MCLTSKPAAVKFCRAQLFLLPVTFKSVSHSHHRTPDYGDCRLTLLYSWSGLSSHHIARCSSGPQEKSQKARAEEANRSGAGDCLQSPVHRRMWSSAEQAFHSQGAVQSHHLSRVPVSHVTLPELFNFIHLLSCTSFFILSFK